MVNKKNLLITLLAAFLVGLSFSATAQKEKNWLSISAGVAIPFNDLAKKTFPDSISSAGFAKAGFGFNLAYTYQLANSLGITVMFSGNRNNTDTDAMAKELSHLEIGDLGIGGQFGSWSTGMLVAGPNLNFMLAHHFYMEVRGLIGVGMGKSPSYDYKITLKNPIDNAHELNFKQQSDNATAFAWNVGMGFKYKFYNKMFVRVNVDYAGANLIYDDVNMQLFDPNNTTGYDYINRGRKMNIQNDIMQVTGGVGYLF